MNKDWQKVTLDEICVLNQLSTGNKFCFDEIEYIDISSVGTGVLLELQKMLFKDAPSRAKRLVKNGSTILSTVRPNRRSFLYIKNPRPNIVVSTGFAVLDPLPEKMLPRFLYYTVTNQSFTDYLTANAKGAAYPAVDTEIIKRAEVVIPPLPTQRRIAAILSAYDELIENNSRRIKILEEMARMIYQEWFVKFRFPGHEQAKFVESPLGMIPAGWEVGTLKSFCSSMTYGYTTSAKKDCVGPKFLRITDIVPSFIDWDNVPYCEISDKEETKYLLEEGDIVVARTGATVGYAKRLNKKHPKTVFASYLVRLRLSVKLASLYVGILVESDEYKTFIKLNASGAAQPQANAQVLTSISLVMPSIKILQKFNDLIQPLFDQKEILEHKNLNLRQTRDMLLPKLISGEIDVSDLDIPIEER